MPISRRGDYTSPSPLNSFSSLLRLELKLHRFAAHNVAKVVLPEAAVARKMVDQKLESQPFPERKQLHAHGNFAEPRLGVIAETAVVVTKVAEAEAIQMILVRRIAKRTVIRVVRRCDAQRPARPEQPMKLLHAADHIVQMLDDVNGRDAVEAIIGKRIWEFVQIDQHVGLARRIAVDADRAGLLANAAADVEHQYRHVRGPAGGLSLIRAGVRFRGNSR